MPCQVWRCKGMRSEGSVYCADHAAESAAYWSGLARSAAYVRGYNDGVWSTYRPNVDDDRVEYDRGHEDGTAVYRARVAGMAQ